MTSVDIFARVFPLVEDYKGACVNPEASVGAGYLYRERFEIT
jgi:hypothetical protein